MKTMTHFHRWAACLCFWCVLTDNALAASNGTPNGDPANNLPPHITRFTWFGERADWSHDGKKILFLEKTYGDVFEMDVATKIIRPVTHHYHHYGYTRALYLANGDILLSGAEDISGVKPYFSSFIILKFGIEYLI